MTTPPPASVEGDSSAAATTSASAAASAEAPRSALVRRKAHRLAALVRGFQELSRADRMRFVRENAAYLPAAVCTEMASMRVERLDYDPAEILLRAGSKSERKRLRACAKEPFTVQWVDRMVCAGEVLYDIGANVGTYSLIAAKKPSGAARVFSFEASLANVSALSDNVVLNNVAAQVTPLAVALSNRNGLGHFHLRELEAGSAKHMLGGDSVDGPTLYPQPVITYRLDDLIALLRIPPPNHIKLDVDGSEIAVLEGASGTLESSHLRSVLIEVSTELSEPVATFVEARGLALRRRIDVKSKSGAYRVWYGLFARGNQPLFPFDVSSHPALVIADSTPA